MAGGGDFRVTERIGPTVARERFATLDEALAALQDRIDGVDRASAVEFFRREYAPEQRVSGRFEIKGPGGRRGGVDVRGDGTAEAYVGWIRKRPVERLDGESALAALRRALG